MKLLLGGSPCTHWSIAQSRHRETRPEGQGWELFRNYLIAKARYQPDYFLYENNKSMAPAIREQITAELGVEPILINSALVSAQSRQRLYWTNIPGVELPEDRGLVLRDILESGLPLREKGYTLKANYANASAANASWHFPATMAAEPINITADGKLTACGPVIIKMASATWPAIPGTAKPVQRSRWISTAWAVCTARIAGGVSTMRGENAPA